MKSIHILPGSGDNFYCENCVRDNATVRALVQAKEDVVAIPMYLPQIVDKVDHRHLNHDVDFLAGTIPTAENLAIAFWNVLEPKIRPGRLYSVKVYETPNNFAEYRGGA